MKKAQVTIFVLVAIVLIAAIVFVSWLRANQTSTSEDVECEVALDCVPAECCDSDLCVPRDQAPDCAGVDCAPGCYNQADNSLGCASVGGTGKGSCTCSNNKCVPLWP